MPYGLPRPRHLPRAGGPFHPLGEGMGRDVTQHGEEAHVEGQGATPVLSEAGPPALKPLGVRYEAHRGHHPAGEAPGGPRGPLQGGGAGAFPEPHPGARRGDGKGGNLPRDHGEDGPAREGAPGDRGVRALCKAHGGGHPQSGPHRGGGGREDLRPAGGEGLPHPHRGGGPGRRDPGTMEV